MTTWGGDADPVAQAVARLLDGNPPVHPPRRPTPLPVARWEDRTAEAPCASRWPVMWLAAVAAWLAMARLAPVWHDPDRWALLAAGSVLITGVIAGIAKGVR